MFRKRPCLCRAFMPNKLSIFIYGRNLNILHFKISITITMPPKEDYSEHNGTYRQTRHDGTYRVIRQEQEDIPPDSDSDRESDSDSRRPGSTPNFAHTHVSTLTMYQGRCAYPLTVLRQTGQSQRAAGYKALTCSPIDQASSAEF